MFGLEDVVCCGQDYGFREETTRIADGASLQEYQSPSSIYSPIGTMNWDSKCEESGVQDKSNHEYTTGYYQYHTDGSVWNVRDFSTSVPMFPEAHTAHLWDSDVLDTLPVQFCVLDDWAIALHAHHARDIVHGHLTPEIISRNLQKSVDVVHGRGMLNDPSGEEFAADDDLYGVRWAATELFCINNRDLRPTKMSDVYSFACLMLQMLTGEVPYCGTKRPEQVVYLKYLGREPIDTKTPKVADHYVAFMRWCWSPNPEKRPTMEIVVDFIREEIKRQGERGG